MGIRRPDCRFFSVAQRDRLYLDQPEVGILAFVLFPSDSGLRVVVQAKAEPGNVDLTQLAPSVQATLSNYSRVHGGEPTAYLEDVHPRVTSHEVVSESLQSEHGLRFYRKLNRNITVILSAAPTLRDHFGAPRVRDLLDRLHDPFVVNTDARSVLASTDWRRLVELDETPFSDPLSDVAQRLSESYRDPPHAEVAMSVLSDVRRACPGTREEQSPLHCVIVDGLERVIDPVHPRNFVQFYAVTSNSREVSSWSQPLFCTTERDRQILVGRTRRNSVEFLLKARCEPGLTNRAEFGVSLNASDLAHSSAGNSEGISEEIAESLNGNTPIAQCEQSDEGGRFFENTCSYEVHLLDEDALRRHSDQHLASLGFVWVNLSTIQWLTGQSGMTTNEFRSVVSLLLYWL